MSQIGDIKSAYELGFNQRCSYIYVKCKICGEERWTRRRITLLAQYTGCCKKCARIIKTIRQAEDSGLIWCKDILNPKVGEVISATALGKKGRVLMYWALCPKCGKGRWLQKQGIEGLCKKCWSTEHGSTLRREKNGMWKGGRAKNGGGYVKVLIEKDNPYYTMSQKGYVQEHRLVMAEHLGRILEKWEIVHHINGVKDDNRIENLKLLPSPAEHAPMTFLQSRMGILENRVKVMEKRITILEAENQLLKIQLGQVNYQGKML
jgi:hypothetical protein